MAPGPWSDALAASMMASRDLSTVSAYPKTHGHAVIARSASDRLQRAQRG